MKLGRSKVFHRSFGIVCGFSFLVFAQLSFAQEAATASSTNFFATSSANIQESYWIITLIVIIVVAIIGVFSVRKETLSQDGTTEIERQADEYEIIEG